MQNLQSGDEKGQRASAISDGDIGNKFVGMRNEGMTVQRLCLSFLMKSGLNPPWNVNKKAILPEKEENSFCRKWKNN